MRRHRSKMPPLTSVRAFEAAARHMSFKQAATELCVSQSAISHQVKILEDFLQVPLFYRKSRSVELTPEGVLYHPMLCNALDMIANATAAIKSDRGFRKLKLHVYATFAIRWLLPRLHDFYAAHPEIELQLYTAQNDVDLLHGDVHASIMIGRATRTDIYYDPLFKAELFPVCSPAYYQANFDGPEGITLSEGSLINVFMSPDDWPIWFSSNRYDGLNPEAGLQFESYEVALASAVQGMGVAMGQQPYVEEDLANGSLVEVFPNRRIQNPSMWFLACAKGHEERESIKRFSAWLKAQVKGGSLALYAQCPS